MVPLWIHPLLSVLTFVLTLIFVSSLLRTRRAAGSTMAWLLIICIIPYLGIPLYLFFSSRKFKTRLRRKSKIYSPSHPKKFPCDLSSVQKILMASGAPENRANKAIELLPTGVFAYEKLVALIKNAKNSIQITTFIFGNDPVGNAIVGALTERAAAGISVKILVDSLGAAMIRLPSFKKLTDAGGEIGYFMPLLHIPFKGRTNLRNHRKLMIVDGRVAVLGGMNLAQEYLGPTENPKRWIDLALVIEGNCVADLENIFHQDWAYAVKEIAAPNPVLHAMPERKFLAQVVASGPDVVGDTLYDLLLTAINEAKDNIWIVTPYFIPDESLNKALELAVKRGVSVHVVIPRKSNHALADLARGSFVRELKSAGVEFGFHPRMIHAKAMIVDRTLAVLGSANFDMRSLLLNYELGLVLYSEPNLLEVQKWIHERHQETDPELQPASFWRDLAEGVGRIIGPIL